MTKFLSLVLISIVLNKELKLNRNYCGIESSVQHHCIKFQNLNNFLLTYRYSNLMNSFSLRHHVLEIFINFCKNLMTHNIRVGALILIILVPLGLYEVHYHIITPVLSQRSCYQFFISLLVKF